MKYFMLLIIFGLNWQIKAETMEMSPEQFFNRANFDNIPALCEEFYAKDVTFVDPLGEIHGIDKMIQYYLNLYQNVESIEFQPIDSFEKPNERVFVWKMILRHKSLGGGEPIELDGVSLFHYRDDKVVYHRDYFDLGAMVYEQIPVLGFIIRKIKESIHNS